VARGALHTLASPSAVRALYVTESGTAHTAIAASVYHQGPTMGC
jgi:hypothetical protein